MSQRDKAEVRAQKAHEKSRGLHRTPMHRAVVKGRRAAKKQASRAQRRVDKAIEGEAVAHSQACLTKFLLSGDPDCPACQTPEETDPAWPLKEQHANGFVAGKAAVRYDLREVIIAHYGSVHRAKLYGLGEKLVALLKDKP